MSGCHPTDIKCQCMCHNQPSDSRYLFMTNPPKVCCGCEPEKLLNWKPKVCGITPTEETLIEFNEKIGDLEFKVAELESHMNKLHDMINLEDRITACDVLNRLTLLESKKITNELDPKVWVFVNERLDKIEKSILETRIQFIDQLGNDKKPYICPVCDGKAKDKTRLVAEPYDQQIHVLINPDCPSCKGTGIVWG